MVQSMRSGIFHVESEAAATAMGRSNQSVKMELDDHFEYQYGRDHKRSRISSDSGQLQWGMVEGAYPVPPQQYNPLDEPSPLGLKLKKSSSLVELIQMHLAQVCGNTVKPANPGENISSDHKESTSSANNSDKLKASNIPGLILKIGNWEYQSRHEGDLVAKFYFAKHKIVWEVLESGLKSKIEIQWSDITGMQADCPEIEESSLKLVLARQPLFFRETNPQPRKHTLWQPCSDFTNGEASVNRLHFIKFPQGMLLKHYEKLIQSDNHLNFLSGQADMMVDPPYFESSVSSVFEGLDPKSQFFNPMKAGESAMATVTAPIQPSIFKIEQQGPGVKMLEQLPQESFFPNSVMAVNAIEGFLNQTGDSQGAGKKRIGQFKEPAGLRHAMSKVDIVNCLGNMMGTDADLGSAQAADHKRQLEQIAELLLNDYDFHGPPTDEKSVMARVDSLCSLLEKDNVEGSNSLKEKQRDASLLNPTMGTIQNPHASSFINARPSVFESLCGSGGEETPSMKAPPRMMKKDSFSDLLLSLPRIASLPKFMNLSEDNQNMFR